MKMLNYFDLDPALNLEPLDWPHHSQITTCLHQKINALNVLCKFWQSEVLLQDLNITDALQMLEKHCEQIDQMSPLFEYIFSLNLCIKLC